MLRAESPSALAMIIGTDLATGAIRLSDHPFDYLTAFLAMPILLRHIGLRTAFYVTVQELQAKVIDGVYFEEVLQEYTSPEAPPDMPEDGMTGDLWNAAKYFPEAVFMPPFTKLPPNHDAKFVMASRAYQGLSSQLFVLLRGDVGIAGSNGPMGSDDLMLSLFNANNITRAMHSMAQSMTTAIRADSTNTLHAKESNPQLIAPEEATNGTVWFQQQFVVVRWGWVAFPVVLLVPASVLLVATVLSTHRRRIGFWKTSPLALLFHARISKDAEGTAERARWRESDSPDAVRKAASSLWANVLKDDKREIDIYRKDV